MVEKFNNFFIIFCKILQCENGVGENGVVANTENTLNRGVRLCS